MADRVLRRLERGDACVMLEKAYRDHWGKSCVGVDWTTWTLDDMKVRDNNTDVYKNDNNNKNKKKQ